MANLSKTTQDQEEIRRWAEERGGKPSHVKSTGSADDIGILRIDFPGYSGEDSLEEISWEQFFEKFTERNLALLYQEETAGGDRSNFNKIVTAETAQENEERSHKSSGRGGARKGGAKKAASKGTAKKAAGKKAASKSGSQGSSAKKVAAKKTAQKKTASKKAAPAKKAAAKKAPAKKTAAKKAAGKKAPAKKVAAKKAVTKKAPAKKATKKAAKKTARGRR